MEIVFLAADAWRPEGVESDTVSLLVNGEIMVDTGWHPVHNLLREHTRVEDISTLILTHTHQDHCIGLPAILFYLLNSHKSFGVLTLYGPGGVREIADMALEFAGKKRFFADVAPLSVVEREPGEEIYVGNTRIAFAASQHAVPGLMLRFTDETGHCVVYSSDTAPQEATVRFAMGADVLIHEHSFGAHRPQTKENPYGHSDSVDAAKIAKEAGVRELYLVHAHPALAKESLAAAREIFANTHRAQSGTRVVL